MHMYVWSLYTAFKHVFSPVKLELQILFIHSVLNFGFKTKESIRYDKIILKNSPTT